MPNDAVIRLTGGSHKGRRLLAVKARYAVRPTQSIVRETLFNWLHNDVSGFHCLDLFAGSGALSWEALSRGAEKLVLVEKSPAFCAGLRRQADVLSVSRVTSVFCADVRAWLSRARPNSRHNHHYDLIFLDPPYADHLLEPALKLLWDKSLLRDGGLVYYEAAEPPDISRLTDQAGHSLCSLKTGRHGQTHFGLLRSENPV